MTDATEKPTRWRQRLSGVDFEAIHLPRLNLQSVDVLSRLPTTGKGKSPLENDIQALKIIKAQREAEKIETYA